LHVVIFGLFAVVVTFALGDDRDVVVGSHCNSVLWTDTLKPFDSG